jgi:hypothetical protein
MSIFLRKGQIRALLHDHRDAPDSLSDCRLEVFRRDRPTKVGEPARRNLPDFCQTTYKVYPFPTRTKLTSLVLCNGLAVI